jgi:two-component system, NarL family, response regulator DegU
MKTTTILIADDHRVFAEGLESILNQVTGMQVLAMAANGQQLLSLMQKQIPDVVLLDISMPEMDGTETACIILKRFPSVKIIMLTMHNTQTHILSLLKLGVNGYVIKNSGKVEVVKAIETVLTKGAYLSAGVAIQLDKAQKEEKNRKLLLSEREKEILQLIYEGLSTNRISEKLFISPRTVETHRKNILNKTNTNSAAQLIHFAIENNLLKN